MGSFGLSSASARPQLGRETPPLKPTVARRPASERPRPRPLDTLRRPRRVPWGLLCHRAVSSFRHANIPHSAGCPAALPPAPQEDIDAPFKHFKPFFLHSLQLDYMEGKPPPQPPSSLEQVSVEQPKQGRNPDGP